MDDSSGATPGQAWQAFVGAEGDPASEWTMEGLRAHVDEHPRCAGLDGEQRAQLLNLLAAHLRAALVREIQGLHAEASGGWHGPEWTGPVLSQEPVRTSEPHATELVALAQETAECVFRSEHWEIDADGLQGDESLAQLVSYATWRGDPASEPFSKVFADLAARLLQHALDQVKRALAAEAYAAMALGAVRDGQSVRARQLVASWCLQPSDPRSGAPSWERFARAVVSWCDCAEVGDGDG